MCENKRRNDIPNNNEQAILFIQLHIHVLCTTFCPSQHSYGSFESKVSLFKGLPALQVLAVVSLLTLTG